MIFIDINILHKLIVSSNLTLICFNNASSPTFKMFNSEFIPRLTPLKETERRTGRRRRTKSNNKNQIGSILEFGSSRWFYLIIAAIKAASDGLRSVNPLNFPINTSSIAYISSSTY
ncbi:hypothetical protein RYX36_026269 [Vicia faba]